MFRIDPRPGGLSRLGKDQSQGVDHQLTLVLSSLLARVGPRRRPLTSVVLTVWLSMLPALCASVHSTLSFDPEWQVSLFS
jgi:hypothetical protein